MKDVTRASTVVYLLVTSNLVTTVLAVVLAIRIWNTRRQRKLAAKRKQQLGKADDQKGSGSSVIAGRPPAELPEQSPLLPGQSGAHRRSPIGRRDSFPYGHYQKINEGHFLYSAYSEPLRESQIFRMVMAAVHQALQKSACMSREATTELIQQKTKMLIEEYLEPATYVKRKGVKPEEAKEEKKKKKAKKDGEGKSEDKDLRDSEEAIYGSACASAESTDYSSTLSKAVMHEIHRSLTNLLDQKYNTLITCEQNGKEEREREESLGELSNGLSETSSSEGPPEIAAPVIPRAKREEQVYETLP